MTDLISRQDAMALLVDIFDETCPEAWNSGVEACLEALNNMPNADTLATNEINPLSENVRVSVGSTQRWGWPFT